MRKLTEIEQETLNELQGAGLTAVMLIQLDLPINNNSEESFSYNHKFTLMELSKHSTPEQACREINQLNTHQAPLLYQADYSDATNKLRGDHLRAMQMGSTFTSTHHLAFLTLAGRYNAIRLCEILKNTTEEEAYQLFVDYNGSWGLKPSLFSFCGAFFAKSSDDNPQNLMGKLPESTRLRTQFSIELHRAGGLIKLH